MEPTTADEIHHGRDDGRRWCTEIYLYGVGGDDDAVWSTAGRTPTVAPWRSNGSSPRPCAERERWGRRRHLGGDGEEGVVAEEEVATATEEGMAARRRR